MRHHSPTISFLVQQRADPIVKSAGHDRFLVWHSPVAHRLSRFFQRHTSEKGPSVLHLQGVNSEQQRFLEFPFYNLPERADDLLSFRASRFWGIAPFRGGARNLKPVAPKEPPSRC